MYLKSTSNNYANICIKRYVNNCDNVNLQDVTPENFLKILQGDEEGMQGIGSGKVIKRSVYSLYISF